ncbi:hypothetical protein [Sphingomonas crusticola]|uniref:hypothetical protein n=1 Tax=Sphingomonas crusticola TaxID=1697973 RepID=UPI0019672D5C|nr:hypothetical protein [Sphingomonas crusticola]
MNAIVETSAIHGWGVDADPENDPTYPMRDQSSEGNLKSSWTPPQMQETQVEILQSIEYIRRPAVAGTSTPPSGISGIIRRAAFTYSESHWFHWLMLMGADRINVVEGVLHDLTRGKIPNIPREMGVRAEWRHNKQGRVKKIAVTASLSGALAAFALYKRKKEPAPSALPAERASGAPRRRLPAQDKPD